MIYGAAAFLATYLLLLAPPDVIHPFPPIFLFATAYAVVPLTSVTLVPLLTKHVSTGLGLHKSVDNIGATLSQTFAGLLLDAHLEEQVTDGDIELDHEGDDLVVIRMFAVISGLGLLSCCLFWWCDKKYKGGILNSNHNSHSHSHHHSHHNHHHHEGENKYKHLGEEETPDEGGQILQMHIIGEETNVTKIAASKKRKRTTIYMWIFGALLCICWVVFFVVAYEKAGVHEKLFSNPSEPLNENMH